MSYPKSNDAQVEPNRLEVRLIHAATYGLERLENRTPSKALCQIFKHVPGHKLCISFLFLTSSSSSSDEDSSELDDGGGGGGVFFDFLDFLSDLGVVAAAAAAAFFFPDDLSALVGVLTTAADFLEDFFETLSFPIVIAVMKLRLNSSRPSPR